ncbi:MAG: histidinol-phosphate transaminase [Lachnospiraceae bacterium]
MKNWKNNIRKVVPYVPGEQPKEEGIIKLNTNENPYPPSDKVLEARDTISQFRKYPDPAATGLVEAIAKEYQVNKDRVFVGVGSDDVLAMSFMTFFNSDKPVFFPDITYSFYDVWADLFRIPYERKSLDDDFCIVKEDYHAPNGGIIFPNPNAPTGMEVSTDFIRDILEHNRDSIVIIDEAYIDFGAQSAVPLTEEYENLLVVQTFSKSRSMAGMRIGYAIGQPELIKALNDVKYSFNSYTMNEAAIRLGIASLQDRDYFRNTVNKIIATREWTKEELHRIGFQFPDSKANFIFATHPDWKAEEIYEAAKKNKIYLRYFKKPRIDNYLRITIGTDEEMRTFIDFLHNFTK